jgi:hypothetical protein
MKMFSPSYTLPRRGEEKNIYKNELFLLLDGEGWDEGGFLTVPVHTLSTVHGIFWIRAAIYLSIE